MRPGSAEDLADLVVRAGPRLKRIAARFRIPAAEAEDLVQDAWLAAVREWERLENPEAWLIRTVFYLCCFYHRKRRRRQWLQLMDGHLLQSLRGPGRPRARIGLIEWEVTFPRLDLTFLLPEVISLTSEVTSLRWELTSDRPEVTFPPSGSDFRTVGAHPSPSEALAATGGLVD